MKSVEQIQEYFECDSEMADRIFQVQTRGFAHGVRGWYFNGDYSSDADWCYGVGAEIQRIEDSLGIEDGGVFEFYSEAHSRGLKVRGEGDSYAL